MPVSIKHADYSARCAQWERCRDAYEGSDAVKAKSETYLDKLPVQDSEEYEKYKRRALWYGATARTVDGLTGAVTRKDPQFMVPDAIVSHLNDVTLMGTPASIFVKETLSEILKVGRHGILVDMSTSTDPARPSTTRPYWTCYKAEQIINWRTAAVNGATVLVLVVLKEYVEKTDKDDEFEVQTIERYRVLSLEDGVYRVRVFTLKDGAGKTEEYDIKEFTPVFREQPLTEIPFCFVGVRGLGAETEKPPLLDVVDVNYSHYHSSADLEHGRHYTALPTPWVAGFPKDTKLRIGSSFAWIASDPAASAGMLEFTGQGLGALEKALESKERLMAVLGARMLEAEKAGVEASETLLLRSAGERSTLQSIAIVVGLAFTKILRWHAMWAGIKETSTISAELNSDFTAAPMTSAELTALMQAWQGGGISYETFYYNLQRGELTRPDITAEDERTLIETQMGDVTDLTTAHDDTTVLNQPDNQDVNAVNA